MSETATTENNNRTVSVLDEKPYLIVTILNCSNNTYTQYNNAPSQVISAK